MPDARLAVFEAISGVMFEQSCAEATFAYAKHAMTQMTLLNMGTPDKTGILTHDLCRTTDNRLLRNLDEQDAGQGRQPAREKRHPAGEGEGCAYF